MSQDASQNSGSSPKPTDQEIATYVADTCRELLSVASTPKLRIVAHLLRSAQDEAEHVARALVEDRPR